MQGREPSLWSPGRRIIDGDFLVRCHRRGRWDRRFQSGWNTRQGRARCSGDGYARRRVQCFAVIRAADRWQNLLRMDNGDKADRLREGNARAKEFDPTLGGFELLEARGPDGLVANEAARRHYFGEDMQ